MKYFWEEGRWRRNNGGRETYRVLSSTVSMNIFPIQNIKDTIKLASLTALFMTKYAYFKVLSHDMVTWICSLIYISVHSFFGYMIMKLNFLIYNTTTQEDYEWKNTSLFIYKTSSYWRRVKPRNKPLRFPMKLLSNYSKKLRFPTFLWKEKKKRSNAVPQKIKNYHKIQEFYLWIYI